MNNSGSVANKIVMEANTQSAGSLTDTAGLTDIYNAAKTTSGGTVTWTHAACEELSVTPSVQYGIGGETVNWKVTAETVQPGAEGVRYYLLVFQGNGAVPRQSYTITANEENTITSPALPAINVNAVYRFHLLDGLESNYADATVKVSSSVVTPPAAVADLIYNGKEQSLVTAGGTSDGTMLYRLGTDGAWSETIPAAKNAGTYKVYYKLSGDSENTDQAFTEAAIARKPVTVSGNDAATQVGTDLAELGWTASGWAPKSIDIKLPAGTTQIEEAAFEGVPVKSVEIPAGCEWIYPDAFKNCTGLKQVRFLSADTKITPTAFAGCTDIYIFAPAESLAKYLCTEENGFIFVADVKSPSAEVNSAMNPHSV